MTRTWIWWGVAAADQFSVGRRRRRRRRLADPGLLGGQSLAADPHPGSGGHHGEPHAAVCHHVTEVEQLVVLGELDEVLSSYVSVLILDLADCCLVDIDLRSGRKIL